MFNSKSDFLVITGPTAMGKSQYAIEIAKQTDAEIINADSQQVYKYFDIGTGKPSREDLASAPHHLFDICEPTQQFDAGKFVEAADKVISGILLRKRKVIIVGGTGLYLKALINGLAEMPPRDSKIRDELEQELKSGCVEDLYHKLSAEDSKAASTIDKNNPQRIIRALEVWRSTKRSIIDWQSTTPTVPRYTATWIGIATSRDNRRKLISKRIDNQIAAGWRDEVANLLKCFPITVPAFQAIGYREIGKFLLEGGDWDSTVENVRNSTYQYAKRQMTFLRKMPDIEWRDLPF